MIRGLLLAILLALVATQSADAQGCPICGPAGLGRFDPNGPRKNFVVQGGEDTLTCFDLYEIFEIQNRNYRIGEYSCTWAKWSATQNCDCSGQLWQWPDTIENDICDPCGRLLDPAREFQPTSFYGQTCSAIITGGFGRGWNTQQCSQAKVAMDNECGCAATAASSTPAPTPSPTPSPTPAPVSGGTFSGTCRSPGSECQDDFSSCCEGSTCAGDRTNPTSGKRYCSASSGGWDDGSGSSYASGTGRGGGNGSGGRGGGGGARNLRAP